MEEGRQNIMNPIVFLAASTGDSSFFENLTDPNGSSSTLPQVTIEKNTVLHVALQFKKFEAAKTIVNLRPSLVYETNSKGNTPLHVVARVGDSSMVKLLMAKKLDVETGGRQQLLSMVNQDGDTALHVAVRYGNFDVVKELINEKDPAELAMKVNKAGESALFLAVDRQDFDMASHILSAAPNCSYAGRHGMNVLHALVIQASSYINPAATGVMESFKKIIIEELKLYASFFKGTWEAMDFHKRARAQTPGGVSQKKKTPGGGRATPYTRIIGTVMKKCPSTIEQKDDLGWTPLHMAAHMGNKEFVKLLLENDNSSAYLKNKAFLSALHIAAKKGNANVMEELTTACPDIYELLNERHQSALHVAAESGERAAVEFFLKRPEFNGLINEQDIDGNTPMHLAANNGHYRIVSQMARCTGVNANVMNIKGSTIMDIIPSGKLDFQLKGALWREGARPGLMELLKREEKADNSMPESSDPLKKAELVVATLIATVTFAAAFTVPGGFKTRGVDEGSAVLSKTNAFQIFLIANSAAFGLSLASVFSHFSASTMILDIIHRKKIVARALDSTSFSTFAMLLAFIVGTYTVVPHYMGITIAAVVCLCFFGNYIFSLLHRLKSSLSLLVSSPTQKKNKQEVKKNGSETRTTTETAAEATATTKR